MWATFVQAQGQVLIKIFRPGVLFGGGTKEGEEKAYICQDDPGEGTSYLCSHVLFHLALR